MDRDEELLHIKKVIDGDLASFSYLVEDHKQGAFSLALRIVKNQEDAEEVAQDAFLKAYRSLKNFKRESAFSTWLYRIVYNTALSHLRKKQLPTTVLETEHSEYDLGETNRAFTELVREDQRRYLALALEKLSAEEATMINLYYSKEKGMDEIAEIVGLSHGNVRVKLLRTRKKLHGILSGLLKKEMRDIL